MKSRSQRKKVAGMLILIQVYQLLYPNVSHALMSGPSQPEVQSFEPVSTTQTVDQFTGDFTYNIPLMDVDGYPVNISYHSGAGMEDDASWVGLGWNINPGCINRNVRGLPDDFNGQKIERTVKSEPEKITTMSSGISFKPELAGKELPVNVSISTSLTFNNYKGISAGTNVGVSAQFGPYVNGGFGLGVNSQDGADVSASMSISSKQATTANNGQISLSAGTGFNTRTGLKNITYSTSLTTKNWQGDYISKADYELYGSYIPIGMQNYVACTPNPTTTSAYSLQVKFGPEFFMGYLSFMGRIDHSVTRMGPAADGGIMHDNRKAYDYLHAENADAADMTDYSREKDGFYNKTQSFLPTASMTYDIFSVSGQGTGGMFRPFRNDVGTIYDAYTAPGATVANSVEAEIGYGEAYEVGFDYTNTTTNISSGPWQKFPFAAQQPGSLFENAYFKQGGELTRGNVNANNTFLGNNTNNPQYVQNGQMDFVSKIKSVINHPDKMGNATVLSSNGNPRMPRGNHLKYLTNREASIAEIATNRKIVSVGSAASSASSNDRTATADKDEIGEFVQTLPDGKRYVYGLPARNRVTSEVVFSTAHQNATAGIVNYTLADASTGNNYGRDKFFSNTVTPGYTHSYLLTGVLSDDYVDVLGDGITSDDLGSYTKFSYNKWSGDFRWKSPYQPTDITQESGELQAQYNPGFTSDKGDDKAQYVMGSKELWHLRTIEGKNQVAIFYTSKRDDGIGACGSIPGAANAATPIANMDDRRQFKLDSIVLFNKSDYVINGSGAVPVKTVLFKYAYELCPNTPNSSSTAVCPGQPNGNGFAKGKLTLKAIYSHYGKSQKNLLSPYQFDYGTGNNNHPYQFDCKNRWGTYKPMVANNQTDLSNWEFPYVDQSRNVDQTGLQADNNDIDASAYQLTKITLPSGGSMKIDYESDDYSFVQDKRAMNMVKIAGVGVSQAYKPMSELYEDINNPHQYIYFKKAQNGGTLQSMAQKYLEDQQYLYYSFNIDLPNANKFEKVCGYAKVEDVGECTGDANYGYIKVSVEDAGKHSDKKLNPMTLTALNIGRFYIPHVLYPGFKDFHEDGSGTQPGPGDLLTAMLYAGGELFTMAQNANVRFVEKSRAKYIDVNKSFIRLHIPIVTKEGGGSRVKKITLSDNWNNMNAVDGQEGTYGQEFDYKTTDPKYGVISSGVASYEPSIGGDENPLRQPAPYTADNARMLPPIEFYQEYPLAEHLYPSPVVGYSKVTVRSIHFAEGQSTRNENVNEFYTARDFPVITDYTTKEVPVNKVTKGLLKRYEEVNVLQGYVLRLNDMHGKPKSSSNYLVKPNSEKELITATKYNYKQDAAGALDNTVQAVNWDGQNYTISPTKLGMEADVTVDSREHDQLTTTTRVQPNINTFVLWGVPIIIPTLFMPAKRDDRIFKTLVTTKIVQQYGLLQSVETIDHGARNIVENVLYDSETGNVLLTRTNNEYDDHNYSLTIPAYQGSENDRMGSAYRNDGYEERPDSMRIENVAQIGTAANPGYLNAYMYTSLTDNYNIGDELLVEFNTSADHVSYNYPGYDQHKLRMWVAGTTTVQDSTDYKFFMVTNTTTSPGGQWVANGNEQQGGYWSNPVVTTTYSYYLKANSITPPKKALILLPRTKKVIDNTAGVTPWIDPNQTVTFGFDPSNYLALTQNWVPGCPTNGTANTVLPRKIKNLTVKVIRSGKRNELSAPLTQLAFNSQSSTPFIPTTYAALLGNNTAIYGNLLSASANKYGDSLGKPFANFPNNFQFNDFVLGHRGIFRPSVAYGPLVDRVYNPHNRASGKFVLQDFLQQTATGITMTLGSQWKELKTALKYSPFGALLEDRDNNNIHSTSQLGYNNSLVTAVTYNAEQQESVFENFEDIKGLFSNVIGSNKGISNWQFSPFKTLFGTSVNAVTLPVTGEPLSALAANTNLSTYAHTGHYALKVLAAMNIPLSVNSYTDPNYINPFNLKSGAPYIISLWATTPPGSIGGVTLTAKTPAIEGWTKYEASFATTNDVASVLLALNAGTTVDDIRIMPDRANMKSFVYDVFTRRLMATLDENHFATFYEYDAEGQLVRTKKETERGIITLQETRKSTRKP